MTCAVIHGPTVAAMSTAISAVEAGTAPFCDNKELCPTAIIERFGARAVENSVFCHVMCCCRTAVGPGGRRRARQRCVENTLDFADELLGHQSRYKAEISYNMTTIPPSPFMHRDDAGLQRSENWQTRARQEIPGFEPNAGMVRRPDIVVVRNPSQPPTQDNIERIVEMKFRGDPDDASQLAAYQAIAGPRASAEIRREESCDCGNDDLRRVPVPVPVPEPVPVPVPQTGDRVMRQPSPADRLPRPDPEVVPVLVIFGLGVATVAGALFIFDGPASELVLGSAFLAALGTRM